MYRSKALFICTIFLVHNLLGQADIGSVHLSKKMSVLNGRASFIFPATAYTLQRSANGFDAAPNPNEETRIIYDTGKMRLVFFAQELYQLGDKNLLDEVNADSAYHKNFRNDIFISSDSLYAIMSVPYKYDTTQRAVLVNSLLVQTKDGTLFRIDAYINSNAYLQRKYFLELSYEIFKTLINGPRSNLLNRRVEECPLPDSTKSLRFLLPNDYCVSVDKQFDKEIFKVIKYSNFKNPVRANIMIYAGGQPEYMYGNYGEYKKDAFVDSSGLFLGQPTKWMTFNDPMHGIYFEEQGIPYTNMSLNTTMHVAMLTNSPDMLFELNQVVAEIELKTK